MRLVLFTTIFFWATTAPWAQYQRITDATTNGGTNRRSINPSMTPDGRYIAFSSDADLLNEGRQFLDFDIWLYDRVANSFSRITDVTANGATDRGAFAPQISNDGNFIMFYSDGDFLNEGRQDGDDDIWLYNVATTTLTRVTDVTNGGLSGRVCRTPSISGDGNWLAFSSNANLDGTVTTNDSEIWLYERQTASLTRVTDATTNGGTNRSSSGPSLTTDGRYICFTGSADLLSTGLPSGQPEVWIYDRITTAIARLTDVSVNGGVNRGATTASISRDGQLVAFSSDADFLNEGRADNLFEAWLLDRTTMTFTRMTDLTANGATDRRAFIPIFSTNGQVIAFTSDGDFLSQGIPDNQVEIWLYSITNGNLIRATNSGSVDRASTSPTLSFDGSLMAFHSDADHDGSGIIDNQFEIFFGAPPLDNIGTGFTYQGRLANGTTPIETNVDLRFTLYDVMAGGSPLAPGIEFLNTAYDGGIVQRMLNFGDVFDGGRRYLEVEVADPAGSSYTILGPRIEVKPVPYSMYATKSRFADFATSVLVDQVNDADADPTNELQDLSSTVNGTNRTINISGGTGTTISVADNDNSVANELQSINVNGSLVTLSIGGSGRVSALAANDGLPTNAVTVDNVGNVTLLRPDSEVASLSLRGLSQGGANLFLGQNIIVGGGITYDGDGIPDIVGDNDRITFYRRTSGTDSEVFSYSALATGADEVRFTGELQTTGLQARNSNGLTFQTDENLFRVGLEDSGRIRIGLTNNSAALTDVHLKQSFSSTTGGGGILFEESSSASSASAWKLYHSGLHFSFAEWINTGDNFASRTRLAYVESGSGDYVQPSDARFKQDISDAPDVLNRVNALRPVTYRHTWSASDSPEQLGFLAQEVAKFFPGLVKQGEDGTLGLSYSEFGVLAIKAIQELSTEVAEKEARIDDLEARITRLEAMLEPAAR